MEVLDFTTPHLCHSTDERILKMRTLNAPGLSFYFQKPKVFLLELFTTLQILQSIFVQISIANLNQHFRHKHQKTKNVFLLVTKTATS